MKYTIVFGSPRKGGNTASLLEPFMQRLKACGNEIDFFDVYESQIAGCKVCLACQKKAEIYCSIDDQMQEILRSVESSDGLIIAGPIYIWSVPAPVKVVMERLVYASCKYYGDDPDSPSRLKGKSLALVTTCGYPIDKGADLCDEAFKRFAKHTKLTYLGMLAERHRNLKEPFMDDEKTAHAVDFAEKVMKWNLE